MKRTILAAVFILCAAIPAERSAAAQSSVPLQIARRYGLDPKKLEPVTLGIGTMAPAETPWIRFPLEHIIRRLREETEGLINIKIYAGGSMGEDSDVLRKMREGGLQGCGCSAQGVQEAAPEAAVFSLPFLFRNYGEVDDVLGRFRKEIDAMFLRRGYRLFGLIDTGFMYLYTRNKVSSVEDLKTLTISSWFGTVQDATIEALGAKSVPVPVPEVLAASQKGTVDANFAPPLWILATQTFLYTHYYVETPFFYAPSVVVFDERQLKVLEKKYPPGFFRDIIGYISEMMAEEEGAWRGEIRDYEKRCIFAFVNSGRAPVALSEADRDALNEVGRRVRAKLAGRDFSAEFLHRVEAELDFYRKAHAGDGG